MSIFSRFFAKSDRGSPPDLFEVPFRGGNKGSYTRTFLTKEEISKICSVRVFEREGYGKELGPNRVCIHFDALTSNGREKYPVFSFYDRTPEEAEIIVDGVLKAIKDWCNRKPIVVVLDSKQYKFAS